MKILKILGCEMEFAEPSKVLKKIQHLEMEFPGKSKKNVQGGLNHFR